MNREENIATLNEHLDHWKRLLSEKICDQNEGEKTIDALQNAIKALEQEPCADCVSRQAVLELVADFDLSMGQVVKGIHALPPVSPMPKMGQWFVDERPESNREIICSNCEKPVFRYHKIDFDYRPNYCPNCGAKMQEV